ncbi:DEDD exonuclease domain-containing protein [Promicromonospora thailandica]|uniref:DNA polymerase-3 subunit epsilon n=1 Tax=Promicromonospora thailandica TaxID=765201 RepID=A0A9X2G575_9MICO|nr:DNA polymerase-3 subunit epsilon [Promicromonospora thailandica]BFF21516.1 DEDD exonuclease domain-containing protein [Promicromonospora thailandica]
MSTTTSAYQATFEELGTPLRDVTFVVVDLETTGTSAKEGGITEIGAVKVRGGEVLGEFQSLVNPGQPVPAFVARLTGITNAMVATAPDIALVLPSFLEFARNTVLVAHNAPFDVGFLKEMCSRLDYPWPGFTVVDTVPLARRLVTRDEAPNHKLSTLANLFHATVSPDHRALADARATVDVLHALFDRLAPMGVTHLEDLATAADPVPPEVRRKRHLADDLPDAPGVYLFRGPGDEVLYVGTSVNIRKRVRSYFTAAEKRKRITEMVRIAERVTPVACATPLEAQVRELRLITEHAPRYNRRSKFPERHSWVRLTDEAYPRLSVVGAVVAGAAHIGPFGSRRTAQEAVHALHDALNLRQCTARIPLVSRTPGSPCALAGMGRCSAPCVATEAPDTAYAEVADAARRALTGDPEPVVRALSDRIAALAHQERYEEAGEVTRRLRAFVSGAHRAQRLDPLARCAELVAARPSGIGDAPGRPGGWEIVVVRHGRLAATDVSAPGADPLPLVSALRTTAEHVEPPVAPAPAAHPEETDLLLAWLDSPGVRLVHVSDEWACPVRAAGAHADLAWASDRVRTEIGTEAGQDVALPYTATPAPLPGAGNARRVDTMTAC